ncbi:MAG: VanZ family protein [Actinomycetaceae bacterium]|nr:VanZ family protein [Actinomycetaceae bacterium]
MSTKPRHAIDESTFSPWWAIVTFVLLGVLVWFLYTPSLSSEPGIFNRIADYISSFIPGLSLNDVEGVDKIVHLTGFALVAASGLLAGWKARWVIGLSVLHAGLSEVLQKFVIPGRTGDVFDALADIVGILIAWIIVAILWTRKEPS